MLNIENIFNFRFIFKDRKMRFHKDMKNNKMQILVFDSNHNKGVFSSVQNQHLINFQNYKTVKFQI